MKMKLITKRHNVTDTKNNIDECTIIVHPSMLNSIRDRVNEIGVGYNVNFMTDFDLLDLKLVDIVGKRIAICTTIPAGETLEVSKKYEGMALVLSKMKLPEFLEFEIKI